MILRPYRSHVSRCSIVFHQLVINAMSNFRQTLLHHGSLQFQVKTAACILKSVNAVKQRMCVRISVNGSVKCVEHKHVVIVIAYGIVKDAPFIQIQYKTQINFMDSV